MIKVCPKKMDARRGSVSSIVSGSTDVSLYNNNDIDKNTTDLKLDRSGCGPDGVSRNYFLRWKGFEGNLIRYYYY